MKNKNLGLTLSEMLCYIVVFSLLITIISSYMIFIFKTKENKENKIYKEIMFIEDTIDDIKDYTFLNNDKVKLVKENDKLKLISINTSQVLLVVDANSNMLYNGVESKEIVFENISIKVEVKSSYLSIKTSDLLFNFMIEVDEWNLF